MGPAENLRMRHLEFVHNVLKSVQGNALTMIIALRKVPVGLIYTAPHWKSVKMELVLQMVVIPAPMVIKHHFL
jgi:hypothetical protein